MPSGNFRSLTRNLALGDINFSTASFKLLLVSTALSEANLDTFDFRNDIVNECPASGTYALGGAACTAAVSAVDTGLNQTTITFTPPSAFTVATLSAAGAVIYKSVGTAATDNLISYVEFVTVPTVSTAGTFTVTLSTPLIIGTLA